jgi:predicted signal transduction protein with EAL and GGDEF domain
VAEGVETNEQLKFLADEGCDAIQGYLMSPAVPAAAFRALLQRAALGPGFDAAQLDHHRQRPGERLIVQR